jgi:hypothetical protein
VKTPGVNLVNVEPQFKRTSFSNPDFTLQDNSPATAPRRTPDRTVAVPTRDLRNLPRNGNAPSLGAYEHGK